MEAVVADRRVRANEDVERQLTNDVDDRIGSSPDSGSWVAVPPRRRGLEVSVRPEVAVSLTGLLSFER